MDGIAFVITMLLRATRILLATGVLFAAVLAVAASTTASPEAGLGGGDVGGAIPHVDPGSPVWREGIRTGDVILELRDSNQPGGWQVVTTGGRAEERVFTEALRHYVPWSIAGLVVAALAALLALRGQPAAAPLLPIAFEVATQPLFFAGSVLVALAGGLAVFVGGALAIPAFAPWRRWMVLPVIAGIGLAAGWIVASLAVPDAYDALDWARLPVSAGFSVVGFGGIADRDRLGASLREAGGIGFVDVAYVATASAVLLVLGLVGRIETEYLVVVAITAVVLYPIWRHNAVAAFERFITSRARRDAAVLAVEEERGRLARDIHDAPLQDLAGVIRRLDMVPGAALEADALRNVAERLRDVATALRPPVLQDLGLVAAIEDLRDQLLAAHPEWSMAVAIDDLSMGARAPADVELAALRVMQEAASNAIAHSHGRRIEIRGTVAAGVVDLTSTDDGRGFGDVDARAARRAGHFGLDAMRERAEAVGAETTVDHAGDGVSVRFRWEARP